MSERTGGEETTFPLTDWWRRDVGLDPRRRSSGRAPVLAESVPKSEWEPVLRSAGDPIERVGPAMEKLIRRQRRHAEAAGDVFYLVRT